MPTAATAEIESHTSITIPACDLLSLIGQPFAEAGMRDLMCGPDAILLQLQYRRRYHLDMPKRVVLDTNVLVAAIRSERGASRLLLVGALESTFVLVASDTSSQRWKLLM
jgi:hypothetical protein